MPATASSRALFDREVVLHWARLLLAPLGLLVLVPLLPTEWGLLSGHDLVAPTIPDAVYLGHAAHGLFAGHLPYRPGFLTAPDSGLPFVYPPLSLLLALPAALAPAHYAFAFSVEMGLLLAVGLGLLGWGASRAGLRAPVIQLTLLLLLAAGPVLLTRVDALQGLALAGAALALRRQRLGLALALVTLAVLTKETVVVALVPLALWFWWAGEGTRWSWARLRPLLLGLAPAVAVVIGFLAWSGGALLGSVGTSLQRGVEIESLPGSLAILLRPFWPLRVGSGALGSVQVSGSEVGALALVLAVVGGLALVGGSVLLVRRRRPASALAFALAVGLVATPVLSPQYVLALLPLLALVALAEASAGRAALLLVTALLLALLTQVEFPYLFTPLTRMAPAALAAVDGRNGLLVLTAVLLVVPQGARLGWPRRAALPAAPAAEG
ncbi:MAG: glycosyltransferase 87 family protein [Candidatus Dormibacteria bacterium]